ncbi:MAG: hypothetical protein AB1782_01540 [Cyanobacteriota bacterium]
MKKKPLIIIGITIATIVVLVAILYSLNLYKSYKTPYGHFERVGNLNESRAGHKSFLMSDGKVLIVGGIKEIKNDYFDIPKEYVDSIELFNPNTKKFEIRLKEKSLSNFKTYNIHRLSANEIVFINVDDNIVAIYNYKTNTLKTIKYPRIPKKNYRYTVLNNGEILIYGGFELNDPTYWQKSIGLFDPHNNNYKHLDYNNLFSEKSSVYALPDNNIAIFNNKTRTIYNIKSNKVIDKSNINIPANFIVDLLFNSILQTYEVVLIKKNNDDYSVYALYNFLTNESTYLGETNYKGYSCKVNVLNDKELLFSACICYSEFIIENCKNAEIFNRDKRKFVILNGQKSGAEISTVNTKSKSVLLTGGRLRSYNFSNERIDVKTLKDAKVFKFKNN